MKFYIPIRENEAPDFIEIKGSDLGIVINEATELCDEDCRPEGKTLDHSRRIVIDNWWGG